MVGDNDDHFRDMITTILTKLHEPEIRGREDGLSQLRALDRGRTFDALISLLDDENGQTRGDAAEALMKIDGVRGQTHVVKLLFDEEPPLRWHVVGLLFAFGNSEATDDLIRVLRSDESGDVRYLAACALGRIGTKDAVDSLRQASTADSGTDREGRRVCDAAADAIRELLARD